MRELFLEACVAGVRLLKSQILQTLLMDSLLYEVKKKRVLRVTGGQAVFAMGPRSHRDEF